MVTFTGKAIEEFKESLNGEKTRGIRIFASAGCCGHSLAMDVAKCPEKDDAMIKQDGIKVFVEKKADTMLSNATIDYSDIQGFVVTGMPQSSCCS